MFYIRTLNQDHGRIETQGCWAFTDPDSPDTGKRGTIKQWAGLKATVNVRCILEQKRNREAELSELEPAVETMIEEYVSYCG